MVHFSCWSEVLSSVESFQMGVRFSPLDMNLLRGELSPCWDAKEFSEKKTTADFPVRSSVVFKQGSILFQVSSRTYRSLTTKANNRNSLNSSAPDALHLNHLQQLTAKFVAVSVGLCLVMPLGPALRNGSLY